MHNILDGEIPERVTGDVAHRVLTMVSEGRYHPALNLLKTLPDPKERVRLCLDALVVDSINKFQEEVGPLTIYENVGEYERAIANCLGVSAVGVLYADERGKLTGVEKLLKEFIPEDHPFKLYFEGPLQTESNQ